MYVKTVLPYVIRDPCNLQMALIVPNPCMDPGSEFGKTGLLSAQYLQYLIHIPVLIKDICPLALTPIDLMWDDRIVKH